MEVLPKFNRPKELGLLSAFIYLDQIQGIARRQTPDLAGAVGGNRHGHIRPEDETCGVKKFSFLLIEGTGGS